MLLFRQSDPFLLQTNFDPRDFICLFPDYIASVAKLQALPTEKKEKTNYTISLVISQIVQDQVIQSKDKIDTSKKVQEYLTSAKEFLI